MKILKNQRFLFNRKLTLKLCEIGAFEILTEVFRERIKRGTNHELNSLDLRSLLKYWDKFNPVVMVEISLKLLADKRNIVALTKEDTQKNIVKIVMVHVYSGAELLSRIPISQWSNTLDKEVLNAVESHLKEPFHIIYSQKPLVTFVLLQEFLQKLTNKTIRYKNRCVTLQMRLLQIGKYFVNEFKDEA